jgi:putative addiction module killer protein
MHHDIRHYISNSGADVFQRWLDRVSDLRARVAVLRRIDRMSAGNFGDHKYLRDGVWELRLDLSGGVRVYFERAVNYWVDLQRRSR